ncbi:MAG: epoxyqueuosine reductase QueH [Lachnospiraceae bacterium]|nr:epoxyqueuosine reductase QueH [Lachnospiraceae bacterium]
MNHGCRKNNYQKELEKIIRSHEKAEEVPTLLLHSCCAPCSSYCLEYLSQFFLITIFYYNPNITNKDEYKKRVLEQQRLIRELPVKHKISFIEGEYNPSLFFETIKGYENIPEGGERCYRCYELRIRECGRLAKEQGFDYFTTTLSISPLKDAQKLNEIGGQISKEYEVKYLYSDFKKKEGYKRSIILSQEYNLYRQNYCGCIFSQKEQEKREKNREKNCAI